MKIKFLFILFVGLLIGTTFIEKPSVKQPNQPVEFTQHNPTVPPCFKMYELLETYSDSFNIPKQFAYGVAHNETRYKGPFHYQYNPEQTSSSNAVGPMQVKVNTARHVNKDTVTIDKLRTDIEYNVMTSMKLLRKLKDKYGDWGLAIGAYHTGGPCVDDYAKRVLKYKIKWI